MQQPRQVPQIGRQRQQFARDNMPPITHPMTIGTGHPSQQPAESAIAERVQDLALEIYARLVVSHLANGGTATELWQRATEAQSAARAYYEQLGVKFDGGES